MKCYLCYVEGTGHSVNKKITASQRMGEIGEKAVNLQFLRIGFQFDGRSRLEAGIDGIAEVMDDDQPTAKMIAVQVKATERGGYVGETGTEFTYRVRASDFDYWRGSNLPVILVLYRQSDDTYFWKSLDNLVGEANRTLHFDKERDVLDGRAKDRLAALTVAKQGHGYYVPPLGCRVALKWGHPQFVCHGLTEFHRLKGSGRGIEEALGSNRQRRGW